MSRVNPYGVHFIPTHQRKEHFDFMRDCQPGVNKLVGESGAPDVQQMHDCYAAAPNAVHVYRNHPLSEQHDDLWRDPVGTAVRHAATWQADMRNRRDQAKRRGLVLPPMEQTSVLGINEPVLELFPRNEDMSNYGEWLPMVQQRAAKLDDYMSTWVWECVKYGQPCHVGNISGGQPPNLKPGMYATYDWFPKTRKAMEANRRMVALAVHEYWDVPGPREMVDWWTFRFFHCDWDIDTIDVLECGVDRAIRTANYEGTRGYTGHLTGQQYAGQTKLYIGGCLADRRFRCATSFTLNGDKIWESFWIDYCMAEMVQVSNELRQLAIQNSPNVNSNGDSNSSAQHNAYVPHVQQGKPEPSAAPEQPQPVASGAIDPLVLEAIISVESGGRAFGEDGKPIIRFEAHIFTQRQPTDLFRFDANEPWTDQQMFDASRGRWDDIHTGNQADEYDALHNAASVNPQAAYESISMGLGQIMGFNHARIGYPSAQAMYEAFSRSETAQLLGIVNYILSDPDLVAAVRRKDWDTIARLYNGAGNVAVYSPLLQRAYAGLRG